jgi:hypothetical protein
LPNFTYYFSALLAATKGCIFDRRKLNANILMKKIVFYTTALAVICSVAVSCNKNDNTNVVNAYYKSYPTLDSVYNMLRVQPQLFTINAAAGGSFYGSRGTRFIIKPNSLLDDTGANVTGTVQIEVAEYRKRGDMLFSGVLPYSNGEPLVTGGELYINATKDGRRIYLKPGSTFEAHVPSSGDTTGGFMFFAGNPGVNAIEDKVNWVLPDTARTTGLSYLADSLKIVSDSFQYCNAGKVYQLPTSKVNYTMTIATSGKYLTSQRYMRAFMLSEQSKTIIVTKNMTTSDATVSYNMTTAAGSVVNHVAYALIDNRFYAGILTFTPIEGAKYTHTLMEIDPAAFKGQLNAFSK